MRDQTDEGHKEHRMETKNTGSTGEQKVESQNETREDMTTKNKTKRDISDPEPKSCSSQKNTVSIFAITNIPATVQCKKEPYESQCDLETVISVLWRTHQQGNKL